MPNNRQNIIDKIWLPVAISISEESKRKKSDLSGLNTYKGFITDQINFTFKHKRITI